MPRLLFEGLVRGLLGGLVRALLLVAVLLPLCAWAQAPGRALLLISIDGLRPDYVLKADEHGLKIPQLRRILEMGAHATGVRGVLPTVTYPSHTTLLTGVWPTKHGIYSNLPFDPLDKNLNGWYWYSEDITAPTLWEAAAKAGLSVGNVSWPVSVGAPGVRYNIPEYWRAPKSPEDLKLLRALATPGLAAEIAQTEGPYDTDLDEALPGDRARTKYAAWILRNRKPRFMTVHLAALDHLQHATGPFSSEANDALEQIDALVGTLEDAARAGFADSAVCIVSDHGFARTDHSLNLMTAFVKEGLVTLGPAAAGRTPRVVDWKAFPKVDGGSAAIILKDPKDAATRATVDQLLRHLAADRANGIAAILGRKAIDALGGNPEAAFWLDMRTNFSVVASLAGANPRSANPGAANSGALVSATKVGGTHGYAPTHPELLATFFMAGPGVARGLDLGEIDMRSVAPTLAAYLGLRLPTADLRALPLASN